MCENLADGFVDEKRYNNADKTITYESNEAHFTASFVLPRGSGSDFAITVGCTTVEAREYRRTFVKVHKEIPRNVHRDDIVYVMQSTRNIMLAIGAWPFVSGKRSIFWKIYDLFLIFTSYVLLACDSIPGTIYWLLEESSRVRLQITPLLLYVFMTVIQYGIFLSRNDHIRQCLKHVEKDWENVFSVKERNTMIKSAKTGRLLVTICGVFIYTGALMFQIILPLSQGEIVIGENITIRPLACPVNFLFIDVQVSPVYEILFVAQSLTGFLIVSVATVACGLSSIFEIYANGQLKILIYLMRGLVEEQSQEENEINKKIAEVVEHQVRIRSFLRSIQYCLQEIYLLEIMVNTLTICLLLYFMLLIRITRSDWDTSNSGVIGSYALSIINVIIHIFLFCYAGEQLTEQAEKVAIESRELEWYRLPDKKARNVIMLMIMSNIPTKISAGKIMDLSFKTFGDIIKTSGAYFNMLRNVME
ncbi:odorant receptor 4-like [Odontomachus brunneus]|uniref:odorant receptor 4-like n=1 Tax=Odontomachus brunneus TaxID=486640 RepID=UPI0013F1C1B9|nr:odorant receptor 4-like [Odontomachus brunneus]